jgi:putative PIN family toxin of toxin-antitoxin system
MDHQIVLDTNVLVAALKSSRGSSFKLLSLIDSGRFAVNLSTPLVAEYEEVLQREISHLSRVEINDIIDYICSVGNRHKIFYLWRPVLKDADDDFILELAVKCGADIITWNVKDFDRAGKFDIKIQTPREFLRQIGAIP